MHARQRRILAGVLACVIFAILARGAWADFVVREIDARFIDNALRITTALDMTLSARSEEALSKGIPLDVLIDLALVEHRRLLWNRVVTDRTLHRRIQYHALSGQYLVSSADIGADEFARFPTAQTALVYAGTLNELDIVLPKKKDIDPKLQYWLKLRVQLDIEALPSPLRPLAYVTPAWHHNTGWITRKVQR
jgi:Domain of unknown function (DUF4390)